VFGEGGRSSKKDEVLFPELKDGVGPCQSFHFRRAAHWRRMPAIPRKQAFPCASRFVAAP
jgi:hypothetical protein